MSLGFSSPARRRPRRLRLHGEAHDSYQGITQTQISRATMLLVPPERAYKWLAPSGEIFGSKKALVQAGFAPADKPRSPRAGAKKIMQARAESVSALVPFEQFDLYDERS